MGKKELSALEEDAYCLMEAAVLLDEARKGDSGVNEEILEMALSNNLELWVAIRSVISQPENLFSDELKENLIRLSDFVAATTCAYDREINEHVLGTLININLQISEGLLEGSNNSE